MVQLEKEDSESYKIASKDTVIRKIPDEWQDFFFDKYRINLKIFLSVLYIIINSLISCFASIQTISNAAKAVISCIISPLTKLKPLYLVTKESEGKVLP